MAHTPLHPPRLPQTASLFIVKKSDDDVSWARLGRTEKLVLVMIAVWVLLYFTAIAPGLLPVVTLATATLLVAGLIKIGRMAIHNLIWRLRNRLIVAYLFVAVVPIVLMLALLLVTSYAVVGQMAVYLVNKELDNRMRTLGFPAETLTRAPASDPETALKRALPMLRHSFPKFEMVSTGAQDFHYPPDSKLESPPEPWKNSNGLITKKDHNALHPGEHLFAWAHSESGGNEVTILAPITSEFLAGLVPGIGNVNFIIGKVDPGARSHLPPPVNALDLKVSFLYPVFVPS